MSKLEQLLIELQAELQGCTNTKKMRWELTISEDGIYMMKRKRTRGTTNPKYSRGNTWAGIEHVRYAMGDNRDLQNPFKVGDVVAWEEDTEFKRPRTVIEVPNPINVILDGSDWELPASLLRKKPDA